MRMWLTAAAGRRFAAPLLAQGQPPACRRVTGLLVWLFALFAWAQTPLGSPQPQSAADPRAHDRVRHLVASLPSRLPAPAEARGRVPEAGCDRLALIAAGGEEGAATAAAGVVVLTTRGGGHDGLAAGAVQAGLACVASYLSRAPPPA